MKSAERVSLTDRVAEITGKRHCRGCGMDKLEKGGEWKESRGRNGFVRRWRCADCAAQRSRSGFKAEK